MPLVLDVTGKVEIVFTLAGDGGTLLLTGTRLTIEPVGGGRFVETYGGNLNARESADVDPPGAARDA